MGLSVEGGGVAVAVAEVVFDVGLVGFLSDWFNVDAEQDVAHGCVADGDEFDDVSASDLEGADHFADLVIDGWR